MSAFMCDDLHLSALAFYAVRHHLAGEERGMPRNEKQAFALLSEANLASVNARYPSSEKGGVGRYVPGCAVKCSFEPVKVIKAARCYRYQACEHDGWEGSMADKVSAAIISNAISDLPGYKDAAWGAP